MSKTKKPPMRIVRFEASNIKKLKAIDISPNRYINRLSGGNGQGKSSILDSIEWTLVNAKDITSRPIRKGERRGDIKLSMGNGETVDVTLLRTFHEGSSKTAGRLEILVAPGKDGSMFEGRRKRAISPDELQDKLLSQIGFDPLEFMQMKPDQQYHVLRRISVKSLDLDELDASIKTAYDERTPLAAQARTLEAQYDAIIVPEGLPAEKIDEAALLKQLTEASEFNEAIAREEVRRDGVKRDADQRAERINQIRAEVEALEKKIKGYKSEIEQLEKDVQTTKKTVNAWKPLEQKRDAPALAEELKQARTINGAIDRSNTKKRIGAELETARAAWKVKDDAVKEGERRRLEAIGQAEYPIPGLGFGDEEVLYNGLPFDQASHGERIRVSTAIGMRANNEVHVMWIHDGALLDDEGLQIIADLAMEHEYQVWIEVVDTSGGVGFYIEDGEVKAVNEEPLDKPPAKPKTKKTKVAEQANP